MNFWRLRHWRPFAATLVLFLPLLTLHWGCRRTPSASDAKTSLRIQLNWVAEPEFGGIYAARLSGAFERRGLDVQVLTGGPGAPVIQSVSAGQVDFGVVGGDDLVIARARGIDVVAVFATFQSSPLGIMVHASRGIQRLEDLKGGTLAMEPGLPFGAWLQHKYRFEGVTIVPYDGGIARFLSDSRFAQQCYVTSEPLSARKQGSDPQVISASDTGFDPYTNVLFVRGALLRERPQVVQRLVAAVRDGWSQYLRDPTPANAMMGQLNRAMDASTFAAATEAQRPLIEGRVPGQEVGSMDETRWATLIEQLLEIRAIPTRVSAASCFAKDLGSE